MMESLVRAKDTDCAKQILSENINHRQITTSVLFLPCGFAQLKADLDTCEQTHVVQDAKIKEKKCKILVNVHTKLL